jgi:hypothetical protein
MQAWQKLLLQPFTKHPILTLSAASSREVVHMSVEELAHSFAYQDQGLHQGLIQGLGQQGARGLSQSSSSGRRLANKQEGLATAALASSHYSGNFNFSHVSSSERGTWQQQQQQQQQRQRQRRRTLQQQQLQHHKLTAQPPVTVYGRCFETLTVCKLQNPQGFPDSLARPVWSGAQFVRQFWEQQHGAQYKQLLPQHQQMKQAGALRVVFAVRPNKDVRSILNLQVSCRIMSCCYVHLCQAVLQCP